MQREVLRIKQVISAALLAPVLLSACISLPDSSDELLIDWKRHINKARALLENKEPEKAENEYQNAIKIIGNESTLAIFVALSKREEGLLFLGQKKNDKAAEKFSQAAAIFLAERKRDPDTYSIYTRQHFDSLFQLALLEKNEGKNADAIKHLHEALWADGNNEKSDQARDQLLMLENSINKNTMSTEVFEKVKELAILPTKERVGLDPVFNAAEQYSSRGDFASASAYLEALLELCKRKKDFTAEAATTYMLIKNKYQQGQLGPAENLCRQAVLLTSTNESFANMQAAFLGELSLVLNRKNKSQGEAASKAYMQALQAADTDKNKHRLAKTLEIFALIDFADARYKLADDALSKSIALLEPLPEKPELPGIETNYGRVLVAKGDLDTARVFLLQGIEKAKAPEDKFLGNLGLAILFLKQEKYDEALKYAQNARTLAQTAGDRAQAGIALAKCAVGQDDLARAQKELKAAQNEIPEIKTYTPPSFVESLEDEFSKIKKEIDRQ